ncbi:hypothetical protein, partial [Pseudomonas syringae group genomosp. 7]|uniref:hypothetical protein n=1 Tax=Pseudomonas syringae group genomosp. 7 TaxID=251699 RepID=UPI0037701861
FFFFFFLGCFFFFGVVVVGWFVFWVSGLFSFGVGCLMFVFGWLVLLCGVELVVGLVDFGVVRLWVLGCLLA